MGAIQEDDRAEVRCLIRGGASLMKQRDHATRLLLRHFRGVLGVEDGVDPSSEDLLFFVRHCFDVLVLEGVLTWGHCCLEVRVDAFFKRTLVDLSPESLALGCDFFGEDASFVHEGHVFDMFDVMSKIGGVPAFLAEGLQGS